MPQWTPAVHEKRHRIGPQSPHRLEHRTPEWRAGWSAGMGTVDAREAGELPPPYEPPEADDCPPALQAFLYLLMRDLVPPGYIEGLMMEATRGSVSTYTNEHLAEYAAKIGRQITYSKPSVGG